MHRFSVSKNRDYLDDTDLWNRFQAGDVEAYEVIYRTYVSDMFNYGMSIVSQDALVKDCIQELFLDLWRNRKTISSTDNIKYYLLKALKWKVGHAIARQGKLVFTEEKKVYTTEVMYPYEDELIQKQKKASDNLRIKQAISKLTSRQREVITLLFYEGLTYEEVSNIMSISVGSIYTLVWKAIAQLKKVF